MQIDKRNYCIQLENNEKNTLCILNTRDSEEHIEV